MNDGDSKVRNFHQKDDGTYNRCGCRGQVGYEEQCVHEIVLHGCRFKKGLFATWHKRRKLVKSSSIPSQLKRVFYEI